MKRKRFAFSADKQVLVTEIQLNLLDKTHQQIFVSTLTISTFTKNLKMWSKSYSVVTTEVTQSQMWKLFSDVNNWHQWDEGIEYAKLSGEFEIGNVIALKPKGAPEVKVELLEVVPFKSFLDVTPFPFAKMYDSHSFEETPEGLRITDTITVKGLLSFLWVKLVASKIVAGLPVEMKKQIEWAKKL